MVDLKRKIKAPMNGEIAIKQQGPDQYILKVINIETAEKEMVIPRGVSLMVASGDEVLQGDQLTQGSIDL